MNTNKFGDPIYNLGLSLDEFDEIIDSLQFTLANDPDCDADFNRGLIHKMRSKRKHVRGRLKAAAGG